MQQILTWDVVLDFLELHATGGDQDWPKITAIRKELGSAINALKGRWSHENNKGRWSMLEIQEKKRHLSWEREGCRSSPNGGTWQSKERACLPARTARANILGWEKAKHSGRREGGWQWLEQRERVEQQAGEAGVDETWSLQPSNMEEVWFPFINEKIKTQSLNNIIQGHIISNWLSQARKSASLDYPFCCPATVRKHSVWTKNL